MSPYGTAKSSGSIGSSSAYGESSSEYSVGEDSSELSFGSSGSGGSGGSSGVSDESGASESSAGFESCPDPVWDGSSNYGVVTIHSPWDVEYRVEASENVGGTNVSVQSCDMGFSVVVPAGKRMVFDWHLECVVETENPNFDITQYIVDLVTQVEIKSTAAGGGDATETKSASGTTALLPGSHDVGIFFTTGDELWHTSAVGFRFQIVSCYISNI